MKHQFSTLNPTKKPIAESTDNATSPVQKVVILKVHGC